MYNFTEAAERAIAAGAARPVAHAEGLMRSAAELLANPAELDRMGRAGLEFARAHRGATERVMALLTASYDPATG
jgi:3-deoxy-D-manno-octulosonic-acid transferase